MRIVGFLFSLKESKGIEEWNDLRGSEMKEFKGKDDLERMWLPECITRWSLWIGGGGGVNKMEILSCKLESIHFGITIKLSIFYFLDDLIKIIQDNVFIK